MKRTPFVIERFHPAARVSVLLMALSTGVRLVWFSLRGEAADMAVHLLLPALAALIFIGTVTLGERYSGWTVLSVAMGVVFFILKSFTFASRLHTALCIVLYLAVLVLYSLTVWGVISTKKLLYPLFGLPLLYHIFVEDMQLYILADPRPPFADWLPEISVLCIMGALFSAVFAMRRKISLPIDGGNLP